MIWNIKQKEWPKPKIVRTIDYKCAYVKNNGSYNNLPSNPPDSHQSQNAVYWRMGEGFLGKVSIKYRLLPHIVYDYFPDKSGS